MQHQACGCQVCGQTRFSSHDPCDCKPPSSDCRVPRPPRPPKCITGPNVLLDRIICSERKCFPSLCTHLTVTDLPCRAQAPFSLLMVQQSGANPWWMPLENSGPCSRLCIRVCIPVCCQIRDACGCFFSGAGVVEVETCLSPTCAPSECWRHTLVIVPCVRLCSPPVCSQDCVFTVQLEVSLDLYLIRPEPFQIRASQPACPDLPLYPQPCRSTPSCWPQCPEDPDRCGWPKQG